MTYQQYASFLLFVLIEATRPAIQKRTATFLLFWIQAEKTFVALHMLKHSAFGASVPSEMDATARARARVLSFEGMRVHQLINLILQAVHQ